MKTRVLITAAATAIFAVAASAATLIVPAAGTGPGANGSSWQSELTLHTAGPREMTVSITFHNGTTVLGPTEVALNPRETVSIADVVRTRFGLQSATGAIVIDSSDRDARTLAVASRTFNVSDLGEFGQDIPAVESGNALRAGDIAAVPGPSVVDGNRFNFGIYATEAATVTWQLLRAEGTIQATRQASYAAGEQVQYNGGVTSFLGAAPEANDTLHARIETGRAIVYGSVVNGTGDPTFVPGTRTRDDIAILLAGVDIDENGTIDLADANGDGILDAPVMLVGSFFPNHFRIVATGEFDEIVELEVVSSPTYAQFLDTVGTIRVIPTAGDQRAGEIVLRARSGNSLSLLTIPVVIR